MNAAAITYNSREVDMPYLLHLDAHGVALLHRMAGITLSVVAAGEEYEAGEVDAHCADAIIDEIETRALSDELREGATLIQQLTQPYLP